MTDIVYVCSQVDPKVYFLLAQILQILTSKIYCACKMDVKLVSRVC